ncbi:MAG: hypothetical protein IJC54_06645 [Clostridia bacterium]|nr:hypothetical protein [Clostridia bacterium]MBQ4086232.1 hypothetical protein [Clostridia bacterium]
MEALIEQTAAFLQRADFPWAVCGGYALDLFLGRNVRRHSDIDISVFEADREKIAGFMLRQGWQVYQFLGQGKLRRIVEPAQSEPGRNLMCLREGCSLVKFYPCEEQNVFLHEFFHTGIERLDYLEFLFGQTDGADYIFRQDIRLPVERAILQREGCAFLAPELALLYKADNADRPEYRQDYEATLPAMDARQREWLRKGLEKMYPQGHAWLAEQV